MHYATGHLFDMKSITEAGHKKVGEHQEKLFESIALEVAQYIVTWHAHPLCTMLCTNEKTVLD